MWPWRSPSRSLAAIHTIELSGPGSRTEAAAMPTRGLVLQAPSAASVDEDKHADPGDYRVTVDADFEMTVEMLAIAIPSVKRLIVRFRGTQQGASCPSWIFKLQNLTGLSMSNYTFATLPDEVANLTELTHLCMYGSALESMPRTIGRLNNLVELDLYTSYGLHYLPIEVLSCRKLQESRFSTRALYNNRKGTLGLPALPDWRLASPSSPSPQCLAAVLYGTLLTEPLILRVVAFLALNRCSICSRSYIHDLGCYAWSHTRVATDDQALLAFCCSQSCASKVPHQIRFDRGRILRFDEGSWQEGQVGRHHGEISPPNFSSSHLAPWPACQDVLNEDQYGRMFCRVPRCLHANADLSSMSVDLRVDRTSGDELAPAQKWEVLFAGDVRCTPAGTKIGRLEIAQVLFLTRLYVDIDVLDDGRKWVCFKTFRDDGGLKMEGWTAFNKKNGKFKLRQVP